MADGGRAPTVVPPTLAPPDNIPNKPTASYGMIRRPDGGPTYLWAVVEAQTDGSADAAVDMVLKDSTQGQLDGNQFEQNICKCSGDLSQGDGSISTVSLLLPAGWRYELGAGLNPNGTNQVRAVFEWPLDQ